MTRRKKNYPPDTLGAWRSRVSNNRSTQTVPLGSISGRLHSILRDFREKYQGFVHAYESACMCGQISQELAETLRDAGFDALHVGLDLRDYPQFYGEPNWDPWDHGVVRLDTGVTPFVYLIDFTATQFRPSAALPLIWKESRYNDFPETEW